MSMLWESSRVGVPPGNLMVSRPSSILADTSSGCSGCHAATDGARKASTHLGGQGHEDGSGADAGTALMDRVCAVGYAGLAVALHQKLSASAVRACVQLDV